MSHPPHPAQTPALPIQPLAGLALPLLALALLTLIGCSATREHFAGDQSPTTGLQHHPVDPVAGSAIQPGEEVWIIARATEPAPPLLGANTGGMLAVITDGPDHEEQLAPLPMLYTTVDADITGADCSVTMRQRFSNPHQRPVDAYYRFPLPPDGRIDSFLMTLGDRRIRGIFRDPDEAVKLYETARKQNLRAALMVVDERNRLTQRVANLQPGKRINIDLRYTHTLLEDNGEYRFVFPSGSTADAREDTIEPLLDITVELRPGTPIQDIESKSHPIEREDLDATSMRVTLAENAKPTRDPFELRFRVGPGVKLVSTRPDTGGDTGNRGGVIIDTTPQGE